MIIVKVAILTSGGISFLIEEITIPEHIRTKVTAAPIESPFMAELVMARVGHIPRSRTRAGFCFHMPLMN
jgi:hypothetical protein